MYTYMTPYLRILQYSLLLTLDSYDVLGRFSFNPVWYISITICQALYLRLGVVNVTGNS